MNISSIRKKSRSVGDVCRAIRRRVIPRRAQCFGTCKSVFTEKIGLEIGGPSPVFDRRGLLPVYPLAARIDNCNFGRHTLWEGAIHEGATFLYDPKRVPGHQYIAEATDLSVIPSAAYDFILSSHTIEHTANPLRALAEWKRVLREGGVLALIVPHKEGTFDHKRPVTTLEHLVQDFEQRTAEDDLTHLPDILALHDLGRDLAAGGFDAFKERCEKNIEHRGLHHHVFDTNLVVEMLDHMGFQLLAVEAVRPYHIVAVARKVAEGHCPDNRAFKEPSTEWRRRSPFTRDRGGRSHASRET